MGKTNRTGIDFQAEVDLEVKSADSIQEKVKNKENALLGNALKKTAGNEQKDTTGNEVEFENKLDSLRADFLAKHKSSDEKTKVNLEEKTNRTGIDFQAEFDLEVKTADSIQEKGKNKENALLGNALKKTAGNEQKDTTGNEAEFENNIDNLGADFLSKHKSSEEKTSVNLEEKTNGTGIDSQAEVDLEVNTADSIQEKGKNKENALLVNALKKTAGNELKDATGNGVAFKQVNLGADFLAKHKSSEEETKANLEEKTNRTGIDFQGVVDLEVKSADSIQEKGKNKENALPGNALKKTAGNKQK